MTQSKQTQNQEAVPFFARYLEGQIKQQKTVNVEETRKYPSDEEDEGDIETEKYPSDEEDEGGIETEKYPSDEEDEGDVGTMKYPSDEEDG